MATGVNELLDMLFEMIDEAKNVPFASDKCMLERDKALDLIDEIRGAFPVELAEAKKLLAARNEYIASAKREGELIVQQANEKAKQILAEDELAAQAKQRGAEMIRQAEEKARELKKAVAEAYDEIKKSRSRFRAAAAGLSGPSAGQNQVFDAEAEEEN